MACVCIICGNQTDCSGDICELCEAVIEDSVKPQEGDE